MTSRVSQDHAILTIIKRMRRFAHMLTANEEAADKALLAVVKDNLDDQSSAADFGRIYHALLRDIYRHLYAVSDRRYKLSLMNGDAHRVIPTAVKFQALEIDDRAIMALYLVENLSFEEIGSIVDRSHREISEIVDQSMQKLSGGEIDQSGFAIGTMADEIVNK